MTDGKNSPVNPRAHTPQRYPCIMTFGFGVYYYVPRQSLRSDETPPSLDFCEPFAAPRDGEIASSSNDMFLLAKNRTCPDLPNVKRRGRRQCQKEGRLGAGLWTVLKPDMVCCVRAGSVIVTFKLWGVFDARHTHVFLYY